MSGFREILSTFITLKAHISEGIFTWGTFWLATTDYSPYYQGSKLWDNLPIDVIELPDIFAFKTRLKRNNRKYVDLLP